MNSVLCDEAKQLFLFPLPEPDEYETPGLDEVPYVEHPETDNDVLINYQYDYFQGNQNVLNQIYTVSVQVCRKLIKAERKKKGFVLSVDEVKEKAHNAAVYLVVQYKTRRNFLIRESVTAYLYLRVRHELYYRRRCDMIVDFVDDRALGKLKGRRV